MEALVGDLKEVGSGCLEEEVGGELLERSGDTSHIIDKDEKHRAAQPRGIQLTEQAVLEMHL